MKLLKLQAKNWLIYSNLNISFDYNNSIIGIIGNNGSGKSSIIHAILYILYGKTIRNNNPSTFIKKGETDLYLKLTLELQNHIYHIVYTNSKYTIYNEVNEVHKQFNTKTDYLKYIEKFIGIKYDLFIATHIFGQGINEFFTVMTDKERKTFLENLFGISQIQEIESYTKHKLTIVDNDHQDKVNSIQQLKQKQHYIEKNIQWLKDRNDAIRLKHIESQESTYSKLHKAESNLVMYQNELSNRKPQIEIITTIKDIESKLQSYITKKQAIKPEIENLKNQLKTLETTLNYQIITYSNYNSNIDLLNYKLNDLMNKDKCPTCYSPINTQEDKDKITDNFSIQITDLTTKLTPIKVKIDDLSNIKSTLESKLITLTRQESKILDNIDQLNILLGNAKKYLEEIDTINRNIELTENIINTLKTESNNIQILATDIDATNAKIKEHETEYQDTDTIIKTNESELEIIAKERSLLELWLNTYSYQGIQSFILADVLQPLNLITNEYLNYLTQNKIKIIFSTTTQNKSTATSRENIDIIITNKGQNGFSYSMLSGGEKRLLDIAIMLAIRKVLYLSNYIEYSNIVFFDEVFLELSDETVSIIKDLLIKEYNESNTTFFVITHETSIKDMFRNIISVKNGVIEQ